MWSKFSGSHIEVDGEKLLLMRESDISGTLEWRCTQCGALHTNQDEALDCCDPVPPMPVKLRTPEDCRGVVGDVAQPRLPDEFGPTDDVNIGD